MVSKHQHYSNLAIEADLKFKIGKKLSLHEGINRKKLFKIGMNSTIQLVNSKQYIYIKNLNKQ